MKLILFLLPSLLLGQISYVAQKTTTLSSAAEVITVQQPAASSRILDFKSAYVDCSVTCTVTLERNGSPASSTALTILNVNPGESTAVSTGWSSSNVGTGTVINVISIGAGGSQVFDLSGIYITNNNNTGSNFTVRTSSISGTVHITIKYTER